MSACRRCEVGCTIPNLPPDVAGLLFRRGPTRLVIRFRLDQDVSGFEQVRCPESLLISTVKAAAFLLTRLPARKRGVKETRVSVRVDLRWRRNIQTTNKKQ